MHGAVDENKMVMHVVVAVDESKMIGHVVVDENTMVVHVVVDVVWNGSLHVNGKMVEVVFEVVLD